METILYTILLTWAIVGTFQWGSWAVKVQVYEIIDYENIDTPWQWFWAGPVLWVVRLLCYIVRRANVAMS